METLSPDSPVGPESVTVSTPSPPSGPFEDRSPDRNSTRRLHPRKEVPKRDWGLRVGSSKKDTGPFPLHQRHDGFSHESDPHPVSFRTPRSLTPLTPFHDSLLVPFLVLPPYPSLPSLFPQSVLFFSPNFLFPPPPSPLPSCSVFDSSYYVRNRGPVRHSLVAPGPVHILDSYDAETTRTPTPHGIVLPEEDGPRNTSSRR